MRNDNDEIQDLITQLNRIQLQQTALLARLETAVENEATQNREISREVRPTGAFALGDRVRIRNPNPFQATRGTITKIGDQRITVTSRSGSKILRAPKNLELDA
jgi:transcription antitermination factor NusG